MENLNKVDEKLNYKFYEYPYFLIRLTKIIFILSRSGFFSLLLKLNVFSNRTTFFIKLLIFVFERKDLNNKNKSFSQSLIYLGPGFIKFGQALSTRPDIFGKEITKKLIYLQDKIAPFSSNLAKKIIENELGLKLNEVFNRFNDKPIASASVAQVHKAILKNGDEVAVKILRPNIESKLFSDFKFFFWLSKQIELIIPKLKRFKLSEMVNIFAMTSINEVDLRLESSSATELSENFIDFKNYKVPKIYWEFTSKNLMVLEYINGIRIDEIGKNNNSKINILQLTKQASEIFFLQVFRDGFFHADLHPGNIILDDDGNIVPLDFGIMGRLSNKDRKFLAELLMNLLDKNFSLVTKLHSDYNMLGKNVSHEALTHEIRALTIPILDKPIGQISLASLLGEILSLSNRFDIEVQPKFCLLQKTMVMAEGMARQINPKANMWQLTRPLVEKWIEENFDPFNIIEDWIDKNKKIINNFPEFFHKIQKLIEKFLKT